MVRTRVSLTEEEYDAAKAEAARLGISLAELIRRSLSRMISADESRPWMRFAGFVSSRGSQPSQSIDDVVYGEKTDA